MSFLILGRLGLWGALCALLSCGACAWDDVTALHQRTVRVREAAEAPVRTQPTKAMASRVRPLIREAADGMIKRTTAQLKLPSIPAMFRWELVGKVTSWAVGLYQKPKTAAALGLLDDVVDLAAEVLGNKDIATMGDAELMAQLGNVTRLHKIAQHYIQQVGAPAAVSKLVDTMANAAEAKGALDPSTMAVMIVDVANETSGPALAELFQYEMVVASGHYQFNMPHFLELHIPVLAQFGAPPVVGEYLQKLADNERDGVPHDQIQESAAAERMLATAARQLNMPSAIPEMLEFVADTTGNASETFVFENTEEMAKVMQKLNALWAKLTEQLGAPPAVSELVRHLGASDKNNSAASTAETFSLLSRASQQLGFPGAVAEFFDYVGPIAAKQSSKPIDPERIQELVIKLTEQIGAPAAFAKFNQDVAAAAKKNGGNLDPVKLPKLVSQLLRKLGMPAFADIVGKLAAPLMQGKQPDALAVASVAPSLMKVMPDFETANSLSATMLAKLMKPMVPVYENAVQKLTGKMPDSALKSALKNTLALWKPPVESTLALA